MDAKIYYLADFTSDGGYYLRSIQNSSTPVLDLLVRESIQNSLDAVLNGMDYISIDISVDVFNRFKLRGHFKEIEDRLSNYDFRNKYISIRDSGTVGLNGPRNGSEIRSREDKGNYYKLVLNVTDPQTKEGAGGSWGLGKTIFSKIGVGLVIYYSRTKDDQGNYVSRLAAVILEDPESENVLIKDKNYRGISLWGKKINGIHYPLEDDDLELHEILDCFNVKRYKGNETGTCVIIPYIAEESLLKEVQTTYIESLGDENIPHWMGDVKKYLSLSVQKWYAPRLYNDVCGNVFTDITINGDRIELCPIFAEIQKMHNVSFNKVSDKIYNYERIFTSTGPGKRGVTGHLVWRNIGKEGLEMRPHGLHYAPYVYTGQMNYEKVRLSSKKNGAIMMYSRKPGMIISYEDPWIEATTEEDEFLIAYFRLESDTEVRYMDRAGEIKQISLEEYMRRGELSDHFQWFDSTEFSLSLLSNIKSNVSKKIENPASNVEKQSDAKRVSLGRLVSHALFPPKGFMARTKPSDTSGKKGPTKRSRKSKLEPSLENRGVVLTDEELIMDFTINSGNEKTLVILAGVEYGGRELSAKEWESEQYVSVRFPFQINSVEFYDIHTTKKNCMILGRVDPLKNIYFDPLFKAEAELENDGQIRKVHLIFNKSETEIGGRINISRSVDSLKPAIYIESERKDSDGI